MKRKARKQPSPSSGGILGRLGPVAAVLGTLLSFAPDAAAADFTNAGSYPVGTDPYGLAIGDFNADSDPDLAVGNYFSDNVSILTGTGGGSFSSATNIPVGTAPSSIAVGDFNGDSDPDLAVANAFSADLWILLGAAGSGFTVEPNGPYATGGFPVSIATGDFNADSDLDLAVGTSGGVSVHLGAGDGSFSGPTNFPITPEGFSDHRYVTIGDFNGDSDPDLAVAAQETEAVAVLLGGTGGSFGGPTYYGSAGEPTEVAIGDFNGDSDPDLAVANYFDTNVSIFDNGGGGSFTGPTNFDQGGGSNSVAIGKFDNDTDPDLALLHTNGLSILLGGAGGAFAAPVTFNIGDNPIGLAVGDLDGDTNDDLAVGTTLTNTVQIFLQLDQAGYARPKGASPINIRLVPAFAQCTGSTPSGMTHGAPLAVPSCSPPVQSSAYLTMNAPDRTAPYNTAPDGSGSVTLQVTCLVPGTTTQITGAGGTPPCSGAGDQEDVKITTTSTGVRCVGVSGGCTSAGGQYSGKVMGAMTLRITDKGNGLSGASPGTAQDYPFTWGVGCSSGTCSSITSADAVIPGLVVELAREVWQLSQVQVFDGGADGDLATTPSPGSGTCPPACKDNGDGESLFLQQGLFAP